MCMKMSDVRLSNASPTLERVDARQPDNVRPSVRRSLFGSPDPEEVHRDLQTSIEEGVRRFRDVYNFDPVEEIPLSPGTYEWEVVNNAPEFYSREPHRRPNGGRSEQDQQETTEGQTTATKRLKKLPRDSSGSCCSEPCSKRSRTNGDDEDDQSDGAASQAVQVAEEAPSKPEDQ